MFITITLRSSAFQRFHEPDFETKKGHVVTAFIGDDQYRATLHSYEIIADGRACKVTVELTAPPPFDIKWV